MKLLSIVIPTRGREVYCIAAIKDILSYSRDDFELVICDNSDSDKIEEYINLIADDRVVYKHIKGRINSVINMDTAMRMATGEYVCMIGDDDTILPDLFDVVDWAKKNGYVNITPKHPITYHWPNSVSKEGKVFWQPKWTDREFVIKNCEYQLNKFVNDGLTHYSEYIPRVYHGLVRKEILDRIMTQTGHIIGGLSPDVYLSIATACNCKEFVFINRPFTIGGASPKSATSESNTGGHRGELSSAPHLYKRGEYHWDKRIPQIYAVETIWGETAIKALEEMKRQELINKVNQGCLFFELLKNNRQMIRLVLKRICDCELLCPKKEILWGVLKSFTVKSIRRLFLGSPKYLSFDNIDNISKAVRIYCLNSNM